MNVPFQGIRKTNPLDLRMKKKTPACKACRRGHQPYWADGVRARLQRSFDLRCHLRADPLRPDSFVILQEMNRAIFARGLII